MTELVDLPATPCSMMRRAMKPRGWPPVETSVVEPDAVSVALS